MAGVDGLTTFISVEPYSRTKVTEAAPPKDVEGGGSTGGSMGGGGGARHSGGGRGEDLPYSQRTVEQKVAMCCPEYNSAKGCSNRTCALKHWCKAVDRARNRVCWSKHHGPTNHK